MQIEPAIFIDLVAKSTGRQRSVFKAREAAAVAERRPTRWPQ